MTDIVDRLRHIIIKSMAFVRGSCGIISASDVRDMLDDISKEVDDGVAEIERLNKLLCAEHPENYRQAEIERIRSAAVRKLEWKEQYCGDGSGGEDLEDLEGFEADSE